MGVFLIKEMSFSIKKRENHEEKKNVKNATKTHKNVQKTLKFQRMPPNEHSGRQNSHKKAKKKGIFRVLDVKIAFLKE